MDKQTFREVLQFRTRRAREKAEFSRAAVAAVLGVSQETYKKWEIGNANSIPTLYIVKFCLLTKISCEDFLRPFLTEEEEKIFTISKKNIDET